VQVSKVNTWAKLCQWLVTSSVVPQSADGIRLQIEWRSHNAHGSETVHKDMEWKSLVARMRTQAVKKMVVVVSCWHHALFLVSIVPGE
jgi:hypothetical protein